VILVQEAIEKASTLIEALEWIRRFRDKITVIKLGGSVMGDETALRHVLIDIVFMETVGMRPVLVHGGGNLISEAMREAGIEPRFVQGRRYTDEATLKIVEEVLAYQTNERLAAEIEALGGRAMNLNFRTTNVLTGEKIQLESEEGAVDLGRVGRVTRVDRQVIENLCYAGTVPVIPSMCWDEEGQPLNVNADTAAMAVAQSLGAEKLVFLSDINGVRSDKENPDSLLSALTAERARELIDSGVIDTGMIPKVQACLETLDQGVGKVHIIDGRIRHSLLLEVYTTEGIGTQIVQGTEATTNGH
jgi:acetylglutamate kinase